MKFDRKIVISVGASRKSTNWQRMDLNLSDFLKKLETPTRSTESLTEYLKLPKSEQDALKDVGGFVGGALTSNRRKAQSVAFRDLITLDFDNIASGMTQDVIKRVMTLGCGYVIYSTRKHADFKPRLRIILPTNRSMTVDEYEPCARKVAELIGIEMADPTTFEPSRLMYWPSCSADSSYVFKYEDKPFLSVEGILNRYEDWRDIAAWPQVPGVDIHRRSDITKQTDPTIKPGVIGAFCRTYDIYAAMAKYLPDAYDTTDEPTRFTYHSGSTTGGAVVYSDGLFLYSHHATDPCGGKLVNAWDFVRLHKFSHLDEEADEGTPVVSLPSTLAMKALARADVTVLQLMQQEKKKESASYFEVLGQTESAEDGGEDWQTHLTSDRQGNYEKSMSNIVTILSFDPNFKGRIFVDEFASRGMVELPLPWDDGEGTRMWNDVDDAQLALRLEKEYGITGREKIENAIKVVGFNHRRNAVKDYVVSCEWDGVERIKYLLHEYLGAEQNIYTEEIMKKILIAAIARAFSSKGVKFDQMIVFKGPQGIGKSTFLSKLGMHWYSDSLYSFEGKDAAELIQGVLINEVSELSAFTKTETEIVKQFLSKTHDIYREAYGKRTNKYPRRGVFFGSTNSDDFLKDTSGNRRFWPVSVGEVPAKKDIFRDLDGEVSQIWGEAYYYFMLGDNINVLSDEAEEIAQEMRNVFREADPKEGIIAEYLNMRIPKNWYSLDVAAQRAFYVGAFKGGEDLELVERDKVCVAEVWQVCLGGDLKHMRRRESNEITNILSGISGWVRNKNMRHYGNFGKQKGFEKSKIINFSQKRRTN